MTTRTVYLIDAAGLLAGTLEAEESPMQPGTWLLPAGAIDTPPPADVPAGRVPRWNGAAWTLATAPRKSTSAGS
ncbi:hypothetical protein [Stenotrophomonas sp. MMGLT7]|uniref:hypothetical protein n=1 Tax=Stenotrophomonas sp. MMGLT7 TaxID=2901227 RepID=UPI001E3E68D6|nr:hypothetical protein [Stenotrophomonas sp. MMGLT7]MCD7096982.1 hypothetical protein [Stenotrophomonas sp. MMGLT7]